MAALNEVKDKKYTNWLSVNLALDYMKSGLHTFIIREFDCLHQSLVQKIYGGTTVILPPCAMCHASRVKRDENGVWAFKKRCRSDCAVWLEELLARHANPKSEEIYWNNSIVPSWPFQPWECAKVYMPRGQQFTNSGPAECDTQSLLMLLDKCTHFHPKLSPKGLSLTQTISAVRNKIMHDCEMKLSDADRLNVIQQIIQLLEDPVHLKSLDDCKAAVSNILKIDNDSLDADLEMTALRAVVNEFRLELGIQEKRTLDTVDTLREEYKQLREQITKRFEDDVANKLPIQEDEQSVKSQINTFVQQEKKHQDMSTTVISHEVKLNTDVEGLGIDSQECRSGILTLQGNNSNRKRKAVGNGISESDIPEKLHRRVLNRCLPKLVRNLDFKAVSMYIQQKEILDDVTMEDIMTDHIDLHVDEEELTDFLVQEGIQEEERGFRIPVTRDGISCPIEGCHPCMYRDVRKYLRHWEEIHRAMFTFILCPICRQTFKRPSDLRRHLRRIHNLDQDMTEKLVAKARTETRPNKRYIDPGSFLPPRVKDKPSGGIASSLSSTLSSSTNIHVPQSSFSRGGPASCNNTCSTTLLSDSIPSLSCEGSATSCLSSTLSSISDIPVPPLPSVRVNTALFSNQTIPSAPERCIITAEGPYSRPLDLPQYRQQQTSFTNISVGLRLVRITDALQTAITRLATIEGENRVAKERDARRLLEQDNRRLRAALSQKDSHDYCRLNVYVPRDEVVEFEERPDGTLRAVKRLKTGALPFTGQPPRYPAKPYTVVHEE